MPEQLEELARNLAAAKLTGLIPMTRAESAVWCEAYEKGAQAGAEILRAAFMAASARGIR